MGRRSWDIDTTSVMRHQGWARELLIYWTLIYICNAFKNRSWLMRHRCDIRDEKENSSLLMKRCINSRRLIFTTKLFLIHAHEPDPYCVDDFFNEDVVEPNEDSSENECSDLSRSKCRACSIRCRSFCLELRPHVTLRIARTDFSSL